MKIKAIFIDIDGVLTNGTKVYGTDGSVMAKSFNDRDWTAIKRFQSKDIYVCFLSGDPWNKIIAMNRNVPFYIRRDEKLGLVKELKYKPQEVVYVGDDLYDLDLLKWCRHPYCPADAIQEVKDVAFTLAVKGGEGVVADLYTVLYG